MGLASAQRLMGESQANVRTDIEPQACILRLRKHCAYCLTRRQPDCNATTIPALMDGFDHTAERALARRVSRHYFQTFGVESNPYGAFRWFNATDRLVGSDRLRSQVQ